MARPHSQALALEAGFACRVPAVHVPGALHPEAPAESAPLATSPSPEVVQVPRRRVRPRHPDVRVQVGLFIRERTGPHERWLLVAELRNEAMFRSAVQLPLHPTSRSTGTDRSRTADGSSPVSSVSSRRVATNGVSPGSMPPRAGSEHRRVLAGAGGVEIPGRKRLAPDARRRSGRRRGGERAGVRGRQNRVTCLSCSSRRRFTSESVMGPCWRPSTSPPVPHR